MKKTTQLLTLPDANERVAGMLFTSEYLVYSDFELLRFSFERIHIGFVGMVYVTSGSLSLMVNELNVTVDAGELLLLKKDDYLSDPLFSTDCDGWIFLTTEILTIAGTDSRTFSHLYALQAERRVFRISSGLGRLIELYGRIAEEKFRMGYYDIRLTLVSLANDIIRNLPPEHIRDNASHPTAAAVYKRFNGLLMESAPIPRRVKWYADKLGVTPKYLTTVTKRLSGRSVSEWIDEAVLADIRRRMIHTEESMKGLAVSVGFDNPAFFGKYVRRHTGMTPMQLRNYLRCTPLKNARPEDDDSCH